MTQPLEGTDACVCMHTALRKCCDSNITSAAYNLIHIIKIEPAEFNAWCVLGDLVAEYMNAGKKGLPALEIAIRLLDDKFTDAIIAARGKDTKLPEGAQSTMWALLCTLRCFDESDLHGMAGYLDE